MVQNIQDTSDATNLAIHSVRNADSERPVPQVDTLKVVACPVCRAVYIPFFQRRGDTRDSFTLMEAAFLHVCHFCFRCQRPACPQCWNQEHNLCAACSETAHLPFRSPLASFEGLIFAPPILPQVTRADGMSFTCLRNGRCYTSVHVSPESTVAGSSLHSYSPAIQSTYLASTAEYLYPDWLKEVMGQKPDHQASELSPRMDETPQGIGHRGDALALPRTSSLEWPQNSQPLPQIVEQCALADKGVVFPTDTQRLVYTEEKLTPVERIENALIFITSIFLATVVIMIILAMCSADMNAFFLRFIHIDIRTEIAYLLQII